jgi:hypothetical protein
MPFCVDLVPQLQAKHIDPTCRSKRWRGILPFCDKNEALAWHKAQKNNAELLWQEHLKVGFLDVYTSIT